MNMLRTRESLGRKKRGFLVLALLVGLQGCSLDKVEVPGLSGPSELALSLTLKANPDFVVADNQSVAQIVATLRGPNSQPVGGRAILFNISDPTGTPALLGELSSVTGQVIASGQSATAVTNAQGVAIVNFAAPARTDILSDTSVRVAARPVADDANGAVDRFVVVQVIPAEPRLFPPNSGNTAPKCSFVVQQAIGPNADGSYPAGFQILFQSTSSDADGFIARYEWNFGDGNGDLKSDVNHAYGAAGAYKVTHQVTDNNGAIGTCTPVTITVK
jgi:hypothetical protein